MLDLKHLLSPPLYVRLVAVISGVRHMSLFYSSPGPNLMYDALSLVTYLFSTYHYAPPECLHEAFRSCWFKWAIFIIFHSHIYAWLCVIVMLHFHHSCFYWTLHAVFKAFLPTDELFHSQGSLFWFTALIRWKKKKKLWRREYFFAVFFYGLSVCSGAREDRLGKAGGGYCFFSPLLLLQSFGGV